MTTPAANDGRAYAVLALRRVLVHNKPPNGITPDDCAPYQGLVTSVYDAFAGGGATAANRIADVSAKVDRGFADVIEEVRQSEQGKQGFQQLEAPIPLGEAAPLPAFPVEALPSWLADFVEAEAEALQVPPDLPGLLVLAVVATAVQRRVEVCPRAGWVEPTSLYTVIALPPAARKSPAFNSAAAPVKAFEKAELTRLAPAIAEAQTDKKILEARLTTAQNAAAKAAPGDRGVARDEAASVARELAELKIPVMPQLYVQDATPEAIGSLLAEQSGRIAVLADEGTIFEIAAGRYSDKPTLELFLNGHAGGDARCNRKGRPPEIVDRAAITMGLAVQPDVLSRLAQVPGVRDRGLLARFLFSLPASTVGTRKIAPAPTPTAVRDAYNRQVTALLEGLQDPDNPQRVWFDTAADLALQAFDREIEPQLAEWGTLGHINDWAGKLVGLVVRLAGLLHMAHYGPAGVAVRINEATVHRAIIIGRYALGHALHAFGQMGADPDMAAAQKILRWVERNGQPSFTRSEVFNALRGGAAFKRASALDAPLGLLEEHGYIRPTAQPVKRNAGRPVQVFEVNPAALQYPNNPNNPNNPAPAVNCSDYSDYSDDEPTLEACEVPAKPVPFAKIEPRRVAVDKARLQELLDAGYSRDEAARIAAGEACEVAP